MTTSVGRTGVDRQRLRHEAVRQLDPDLVGVDLPRFVASGQLHTLPRDDDPDEPFPGLVHEPSSGEQPPEGDVDTHNEPHGHDHGSVEPHDHPHGHGHDPDQRIDGDVAPPFE